MYLSERPSGGVVPSQRRAAPIEDAGAGGAWRVWAGRLSGWGISNLCQPHRKAILAFSGGFGNLPVKDCHPAWRARSWGSRWTRRDPDIHSGLVGAVFLRIRAPSYVVQTGLLDGWYPSQRLGGATRASRFRARAPCWLCALLAALTTNLVQLELPPGRCTETRNCSLAFESAPYTVLVSTGVHFLV